MSAVAMPTSKVANKRDMIFLCQYFYPEHNSSATLPFDLASHLASKGYSVGALCGNPKEYTNEKRVPLEEDVQGVHIQRLRYAQPARGAKLGRLVNFASFTSKVILHLAELKRYKCVIVYSNPPILPLAAVWANVLWGTKIVFVPFDVYPEVAYASGSLSQGGMIDRFMGWLNGSLFKRCSKVVALTDQMRDFLAEHRPTLDPSKVAVIPNWAHEEGSVLPEPDYTRFGYKGDELVVTYLGNMGICQDMETLLGAIDLLKDEPKIQFLFVGHGSKVEHVRERVGDYRNVQIHSFLTGDDLLQALAVSDLGVVSLGPGLKGMCAPSKYQTYLWVGLGIVAIGEKGSVVPSGQCENAFIECANGEAEQLAKALVDHQRDKNAQQAPGCSDAFGKGACFGKYEALLSEVIECIAEESPSAPVMDSAA